MAVQALSTAAAFWQALPASMLPPSLRAPPLLAVPPPPPASALTPPVPSMVPFAASPFDETAASCAPAPPEETPPVPATPPVPDGSVRPAAPPPPVIAPPPDPALPPVVRPPPLSPCVEDPQPITAAATTRPTEMNSVMTDLLAIVLVSPIARRGCAIMSAPAQMPADWNRSWSWMVVEVRLWSDHLFV